MCKLEFGGVAQRLERFLVKEEVARSNRVAPAYMEKPKIPAQKTDEEVRKMLEEATKQTPKVDTKKPVVPKKVILNNFEKKGEVNEEESST